MEKNELTIGRAPENNIYIKDPMASRFHCVVVSQEDGYKVLDLDSANGTFLNGSRVEGSQALRHGDRVQIGQMEFRFEIVGVKPGEIAPEVESLGRITWQDEGVQKSIHVSSQGVTFGRSSSSDIVVNDRQASRYHCKITPSAVGILLTDLNSTNGTFLNEQKVIGSLKLTSGDRIRIGSLVYTFASIVPSEATGIPPGMPGAVTEVEQAMAKEVIDYGPEEPMIAEPVGVASPVVPDIAQVPKVEEIVELPIPREPKPAKVPGTKLIEVRDVIKDFDSPGGSVRVLKGISLNINTGEFVGIRGPSGSGKSTLINMITGIDRPTSGDVIVAGQSLNELSENKMSRWRGKNIGVIFQFFQLLPTLTIIENVMLPMDFCRMWTARDRKERALDLLASVGLTAHANKLPSTLSGGQQQRAAIARALANDPPLIVADEPTGNLDSKTADQVFSLFNQLVSQGTTFLMVTHDVELAKRIPRVIEVLDGELFENRS